MSYHSQKESHASKRPRLDVQRSQICSPRVKTVKGISDQATNLTETNIKTSDCGNIYDDLWGPDDNLDLEQVELDETLAQSQITDMMRATTIGREPNMFEATSYKQSHLNQGAQSLSSCGSRHGIPSKAMPIKDIPRGVPFRRTASSGYPRTVHDLLDKKSNYPSVMQNDNLQQLQSMKERVKYLEDEMTKKNGEVTLLRGKVTKLQEEESKKEQHYLKRVEAVRQDAEKVIMNQANEIKSLKGQMDVKVMETEIERRTQHSDSPNHRHQHQQKNNSIRAMFSPGSSTEKSSNESRLPGRNQRKTPKIQKASLECLKNIIIPEIFKATQQEESINEARSTTNSFMSVGAKEAQNVGLGESSKSSLYVTACSSMRERGSGGLSGMSKQLIEPCASVESCGLLLISPQLVDINSDNAHDRISQVIDTCLRILQNQLKQLEAIVYCQKRYLDREREPKHLSVVESYSLLSCNELYRNERGICTRRALSLIAHLLEVSDFAVKQIVSRPVESFEIVKDANEVPDENKTGEVNSDENSYTMLNVIKSIVEQIEKQRLTSMFEGVLAGVTVLIKNLLMYAGTLTRESQDVLMDIIRAVVISHPGSFVIHDILGVIVAATLYPDMMEALCHNSAKKTFMEKEINTGLTVTEFTRDTCILQVLCTQLRLLKSVDTHVLTDVYTSWILKLFYGCPRTPKWLFAVPSLTSCQCRPLLSRLAFTLLGKAVFTYSAEARQEKLLLETILKRGVLIVCTLLYHDKYFGTNVDSSSVGYYELFLHLMVTKFKDLKLNKACDTILKEISEQEDHRQPLSLSMEVPGDYKCILSNIYSSQGCKHPLEIIKALDEC